MTACRQTATESDPVKAESCRDPRFEKLAVRKRENGFLWLDGFRISHLSVPANMFAAVALEDAHNLDPCRYS
jgi:hypothetical protein